MTAPAASKQTPPFLRALLLFLLPAALLLFAPQTAFALFGSNMASLAAVITAVLFSLAHINWTLNPFTLRYDVPQLLWALAMGLVQGWAYEKTGSAVSPMIMHGLSNVVVTGLQLIMPVLF